MSCVKQQRSVSSGIRSSITCASRFAKVGLQLYWLNLFRSIFYVGTIVHKRNIIATPLFILGDTDFCIGRASPCFTCAASAPDSDSQYYEMRQCRPTDAADFSSCSNEANFCPGEWNFAEPEKCPVATQIVNAITGLTGKACCHHRVASGQEVSSLID